MIGANFKTDNAFCHYVPRLNLSIIISREICQFIAGVIRFYTSCFSEGNCYFTCRLRGNYVINHLTQLNYELVEL